ncbi:MAG: aminoacyl-tRNA hydrolase [Bacteroidales bacterium]|jgi:PTH1 family peptidyl-tRNA hydrolase|nr:aminoacyl-tRNA hydrolase [Bacteroidales bacterium]MBQ2244159.1 aminoacyl-tRNA hydrolase [Bacteroidales bacterium]
MNYLVVGLGNIGFEYVDTRHNIGFSVLDAWAQASNTSFSTKRYGDVAEVRFKGHSFTLLKPSTYMNLSGKAVNYWLQQSKIPVERLLVIVDDMALPIGHLRLRKKGSDGGHNGLANIAQMIGTESYCRLRIGIGSHIGFGSQVDFVLGKWTADEKAELKPAIERAIEVIKAFGTIGVDRAMNQYNTKGAPSEPKATNQ